MRLSKYVSLNRQLRYKKDALNPTEGDATIRVGLRRESPVDGRCRRVQSRRLLPGEDKAGIEGNYTKLPNTIRKDTSRDKSLGVLGLSFEWNHFPMESAEHHACR
jgi:hypothetical protein